MSRSVSLVIMGVEIHSRSGLKGTILFLVVYYWSIEAEPESSMGSSIAHSKYILFNEKVTQTECKESML